ncbi:MAG: DUF1937 family protein [Rhodobacteraceae bacterium]|nr:DUF1937 family protein [Paracoccaceae bacterium]
MPDAVPDAGLPIRRDWGHAALDAYAGAHLLVRGVGPDEVARLAGGRLAYLATPYSKIACCNFGAWHAHASIEAAVRAARWARELALLGVTAVSPVIQAVEMVHANVDNPLNPLDAEFWGRWCQPLLDASGLVVVPPIPGWRESDGIWREVRAALCSNRQVFLIGENGGVA